MTHLAGALLALAIAGAAVGVILLLMLPDA